MSNRHLEAAHPISLPSETISRTLRGTLVRQTADRSPVTGEDKTVRAFSDDEVASVTPSIVTALSEATPAQQVTFRIVHSPQLQTSTGSLFVYGLSLYLTIAEYRREPGGPDSTIEVLFTPKTALRPDSFGSSDKPGGRSRPPLVIDYELLARLPSSMLNPVQSAESKPDKPPPAAIQANKDASSEELRMELEAVKEELREIKKQLAEQEAEREKQKKNKKPSSP
jgi:hypothetical protein